MRTLLLLLVTSGCTKEQMDQARDKKDRRFLAEAASAYWQAVRWNDAAAIGGFLHAPEDQLRVARMVAEGRVRYSDATVLQVIVGKDLPPERAPDIREGTVLVRIEGFDTHGTKLNTYSVEQHWLRRRPNFWFVDAERSPIDEAVPW